MLAALLALALASQWHDDGVTVAPDKTYENVEVGAPGLLGGERLRVDGVVAASMGLRAVAGGLILNGPLWTDGYIRRGSTVGYMLIEGNVSAGGSAPDVIVRSAQVRTAGKLFEVDNVTTQRFAVDWQGNGFLGRTLYVGPGTGSGNVAMTPSPDGNYLHLQGRVPGGGQHPAFHGAVTLSNVTALGEGEYALQVCAGPCGITPTFWVDHNASVAMGPRLTIGSGNEGNSIVSHGGLTIDPGATFGLDVGGVLMRAPMPSVAPLTVGWPVGRSQFWVDDECECVRVTVMTSQGARTATLPWDAP